MRQQVKSDAEIICSTEGATFSGKRRPEGDALEIQHHPTAKLWSPVKPQTHPTRFSRHLQKAVSLPNVTETQKKATLLP